MIKLDLSYIGKDINKKEIFSTYAEKVKKISAELDNKKGPGNEMTGWMEYPFNISEEEIKFMENAAKTWNKKNIKNILLISIGGSFIGTRAAIDMCSPLFNRTKKIYYLNNISAEYIADLYSELKDKDFGIVVISKSGTTLEPALGLRVFYKLLLEKYGVEEARERTLAVTDKEKGTLYKLCLENNWQKFVIPDDVGGRFSAITPVGLLPCVLMGIDIRKMIEGFKDALKDTKVSDISKNSAYQYASIRNYLYSKHKKSVEVFSIYDHNLIYLGEHLKQLFAESEGKNKKGILPVVFPMTTDLHSVGQHIQEGKPILFETTILLQNHNTDMKIEKLFDDNDGLSYLNGKSVSYVNNIAAISTIEAHSIDGGVPSIVIEIPKADPYNFGYLYSWFSKALSMSARLLGVNPFNQPGVEAYKKRMFAKLKSNK